jgi:Integrase zinc binding domain
MAYASRLGGHMGANKTIAIITENIYWPKMAKLIKEYIKKCTVCIRHIPKDGKHTEPIQSSDKANFLFEKIAIDLIGPFKEMLKKKHMYGLNIVDIATSYSTQTNRCRKYMH